jgi:hypothetical protein
MVGLVGELIPVRNEKPEITAKKSPVALTRLTGKIRHFFVSIFSSSLFIVTMVSSTFFEDFDGRG